MHDCPDCAERMSGDAEHKAFLSRLFGPEVYEGADDIYPKSKWVELEDPAHVASAITVLVNSILHNGMGNEAITGWSWRQDGSRQVIAVHAIRLTQPHGQPKAAA